MRHRVHGIPWLVFVLLQLAFVGGPVYPRTATFDVAEDLSRGASAVERAAAATSLPQGWDSLQRQ